MNAPLNPFPQAVQLVHQLLETAAAERPDAEALVAGARRLTYRELDQTANALAHGLHRLGVQRGDRVLVFADNSVEAAVAVFGVLKAEATFVVLSPLTRADKLAACLNDTRATALIAEPQLTPAWSDAAKRSTHLRAVVCTGAIDAARTEGLPMVPWAEVTKAEDGASPPPRRALESDLAALVYTSGSTGEPKGVMFSHRNVLAATDGIVAYLELTASDVLLGMLPLSFCYGLYQLFTAFKARAKVVLERGFTFPMKVLQTMVAEKVTGFPAVPTIFASLAELKGLEQFDLGHVRYVTNAAAALPLKHVERIGQLFPNAKLYSMYGQTECTRATYLPPSQLAVRPASIGIAIPGTELWLIDEQGKRITAPNVPGQLVVRGPTVMRGYWEKPEATAKSLHPGAYPSDLVLHSGDLCRYDDEGYLYFVARMDDIIKTRGEKVAPKEVETTLMNVAGVKEAAVIGVPDELLGQAVKAFVVLEEGVSLSEKELQRECQRRLEAFMVPKSIVQVAALPKTSTGKIKKTDLV